MDLLDLLMNPTKAARRYSPLREDLTEGQENELAWMYNRVREGEHRARVRDERTYASSDPVIRDAYSRDAATVPSSVDALIKRTPGAVVMPTERGQLLELLRFAESNSVPLVPRGGGTSIHGGAVPVEGGIVADLRGFDEVLEVNEEEGTVRVEGGITWLDLEAKLNEEGYSVPSMPINAPFSTVAGAIAMQKTGFGAWGHGGPRGNLRSVELMAPDLDVETLTGTDLDLVDGCQGASGFILEAELDVVEQKDLVHVGASFDTIDVAEQFVRSLPVEGIDTVQVLGADHVKLTSEALGSRKLPRNEDVVLVALEADQAEALIPDLQARSETLDGDWIDQDSATWAWRNRFKHRSYQRFGPSLVIGEATTPTPKLAESWWAAMDAIEAPDYTLWSIAIAPDRFLIIASILCDERLPTFPLAWGSRLAFVDAVKAAGGQASAPGLLTPGEAKPVLGKDRIKRLKTWRSERDDADIMNPGKITSARVKGLPILSTRAALAPGTAVMKSMRTQFDHRRGSTTEPSNRALNAAMGRRLSKRLGDVADEVHQCSRLGHTNRVGDLHRGIRFEKENPRAIVRAHRFDTQLPRGILASARALLNGKQPTRQLVSHALSLPAVPTYERESQNGTPILPVIEAVREAAQRATTLDARVREIVATLEEAGNVLGEDADARGDWLPGGAPSGIDTTTLFLAGDIAAYERDGDASAMFNIFQNAGFGFTTLGANEAHPGSVPYRLGAVNAAQDAMVRFADAAEDRMGDLPTTVVTASSEDADVLRRRVEDLLAADEARDWSPRVLTSTEAIAGLVTSGRLTFQGDDGADDAEDAGNEAEESEEADGRKPEDGEAEAGEEAGDEEAAEAEPTDEADAEEAGFERIEGVLVHSPFATDEERDALLTLAETVPEVSIDGSALDEALIPDLSYTLINPDQAQGLANRLSNALDGQTAIVGCTDLAYVLDEIGVDTQSIHQLVAQRMQMREGGLQLDVGAGEEEEEGFVEHEIPDGAHRIELVKEEAAIPVYPDESILDAAEEFGFDLPYDCRAGSCVTCCAKWEGEAPDQSEAQAIDEEEQGTHCLTCVAKPTGDLKIWSGESP